MNRRRVRLLLSSVLACLTLSPLATGCGPQEDLICFVSRKADVADRPDIYVMRPDGSGRRNLTNNPAVDDGPSWSPDGKKIAFYSNRDVRVEIYVMDADGRNQARLTHSGENALPRWSPDGRRIAFWHEGTLWLMDSDGSNQRSLGHKPQAGFQWSPDGRRIAFNSESLGMVVLDVETGVAATSGTKPAYWWPAWSPDGKKIAATSDRDGACELYVLDAELGNPVRITRFRELTSGSKYAGIVGCRQGWGAAPFWSPDGKRIGFLARATDTTGWDIHSIDADGGNLTNNPAGAGITSAVWSPDGRYLACTGVVYPDYSGIFVMRADGSGVTRVTPGGSVDLSPVWQPR
ncbi:MAG: hypothetical protein V1737_02810 [Chloroflexota bacterium]